MINTNRLKGHNAERYYCNEFIKLGYIYCKTSRMASRLADNAGIDLVNLPFNVQIKAGLQKGLKPQEEIRYVKERVKELFPPEAEEQDKPTVLIHRRQGKKGVPRTQFDDLVTMTFKDFAKIIVTYDSRELLQASSTESE